MLPSASFIWPSTTLPESVSLCQSLYGCWWSCSPCTHSLRLNLAALSQTEWCHHWADVLHNNRPPMWSLFQTTRLIRTNRLTGSDVRLGTVVGYSCVAVRWHACGCVFMSVCLCLHLFIAAPPSSHWQFACLHFSHLYWALAEALLHKHRAASHHRCLRCIHKHTTKEHESCSNKHTGTCGC